jgi:hypothetical protein
MTQKYRQFWLRRAHEVSYGGITGKAVLGSVATVATTRQKSDSLRIGGRALEIVAGSDQADAALGLVDRTGVSMPMKTYTGRAFLHTISSVKIKATIRSRRPSGGL